MGKKRSRTDPAKSRTDHEKLGQDSFEKGHKFEDRVVTLLRLMGMDVKPRENYGCRETDFVASERTRFSESWYVGECKDYGHKVGVEEVGQLFARLTAFENEHHHKATGLLVVAGEESIGDKARGHARSLKNIELLTYRELQDRLVDLSGYNERLIRDIEEEGRAKSANAFVESRYIPLRIKPDETGKPIQPLSQYVAQFLGSSSARTLTILGDYGTGKTWFSKKLALELARDYAKSPGSARQPIRVNLREVAQEITLQSALIKHFQTALQRQVDVQALLHLAAEGRYIFIFDGFDEMVAKIAHQYAVQNFRELLQSGRGDSKLVLTCRTHYFRSQADVDELLNTGKQLKSASATELYRDLAQSEGQQLGYLAYFEPEQARKYIDQVCGERAALVHDLLGKQPRLAELATRPVLLDMLARTAPRLEKWDSAAVLTVAELYETYTASWFDQQRTKGMVSNVEPFWRQLLEELAGELWGAPGNEMNFQALSSLVQRVAASFVKGANESALAEQETRTALFLTRDAAGAYRFSHRSFLEFFLACRLNRTIGEAALFVRSIEIDPLTPPVLDFLCEMAGDRTAAVAAASILGGDAYVARASENALRLWLRGGAPDSLRPQRFALAGAQLAGVTLPGVDLRRANLRGADLSQADLSKVDLSEADLEGAILAGATLDGARIDGTNFAGAQLHFSRFWDARGKARSWEHASVEGAGFRGCVEAPLARDAPARIVLPRMVQRVNGVALSTDGFLLAVASGPQVHLYDLTTGQLRRSLDGHLGTVWGVALAPDGSTLASGSDDQTVKLWDAVSGQLRRSLDGHQGHVRSVAFAPDGRMLASGSDDRTVKLWDAVSGQLRCSLDGHQGVVRSVAFAPDGRTLASGSFDQTVKLWDAVSGQVRCSLDGHQSYVLSVAFAPDGRTLASGSDDKTVKLWDAASGQVRCSLRRNQGEVRSVAFAPDGRTLAAGSDDHTVKLWDTESGQLRRSLDGHQDEVRSVAFAPDGCTLASGSYDCTVKLWDAESGQLRRSLDGHRGGVWSVAFAPDGRTLAAGSDDRTVKLWDTESGQLRRSLDSHQGSVRSVAFAPDGRTLAAGSLDKTVKLWDAESGQLRRSLDGHQSWVCSVAFAPDGRTLVSGSYDMTVNLWNAVSEQLRRSLKGHQGSVLSVAFAPDSRTLASGSDDTNVKLWDAASGELRCSLRGHRGAVCTVAFAPDGRTLASGSDDKTVTLWDAGSGQLRRSLDGHQGYVLSVAFAPDGRMLASASADKTVKLWDAGSGQLRRSLDGHANWVRSVAFAPDGRTLASSSSDKTVKLWDAASGELLLTLVAMPDGGAVAVLPDGRFDGDAKGLAQVRVGQELALYPWEAFPELRSPEAVREAARGFRSEIENRGLATSSPE